MWKRGLCSCASSSSSVASLDPVLALSLVVPALVAAWRVEPFLVPWWHLRGLVGVDFLRVGFVVRPEPLLAAFRGEPDLALGLLVLFLLHLHRPQLRKTKTAWHGSQR